MSPIATFSNNTATPVWTKQNVNIPAQNGPFQIVIRGTVRLTISN